MKNRKREIILDKICVCVCVCVLKGLKFELFRDWPSYALRNDWWSNVLGYLHREMVKINEKSEKYRNM